MKIQKCNKCLAHYTGVHKCDGLMKYLVEAKRRKDNRVDKLLNKEKYILISKEKDDKH